MRWMCARKEFQAKAEQKFRKDEQKIWETTEKALKAILKPISSCFGPCFAGKRPFRHAF